MRLGHKDKQYIYYREQKRCYYCNKLLRYRQATLDHYVPYCLSENNEVWNLVLACKSCNRQKGDNIPENYDKIVIQLFLQAVRDHQVMRGNIETGPDELEKMLMQINKLEYMKKETVFQSERHRFYLQDGRVYKVIHIHNHYSEE